MAEVFVSYARTNEAAAKRVANGLKANGFDVWRDDQLPTHRAYSDIIEQKLRSACAVVVLWSKDSVQSQWVRAEAELARSEGKLVQGLLDGTTPPLPFNQIQCANLKRWGGNPAHLGWVRLLEGVSALAGGDRPYRPEASRWSWLTSPWWRAAAAGVVGVLASVLIFFAVQLFESTDVGLTTLAVLPFKTLASADDNLAYGIWEDTRQALSRNPQLRIFGRESAEIMAEQKLEPRQYRSKLGVEYILDGSVRRAGERVRVSVSLVRTKDSAQLWSATLDRNLDDIFKLQSEVANEIEGRIRGRLAAGGGVKPENIATSGAVYLLYSEARAALRTRDQSKFSAAHRQLTEAVRTDVNYAPAWAALSVAQQFKEEQSEEESRGRAEAYARRAIALAPNLAAAHAALGFTLGRRGPVAEAALRRSIALDPNDVESLNWLASLESRRGRTKQTLDLYDRAIKVEPLWLPVVFNRLTLLLEDNQISAVNGELMRLQRAGDARLETLARMQVLEWRGDYSEAVKIGLAFFQRSPQADREMVRDPLAELLLQLGLADKAWTFSHAPPAAAAIWRNDPRGLDQFEALGIPPARFWKSTPMAEGLSHAYLEMGRGARLAQWYKAAARSPEQFLVRVESPSRFLYLAPLVALALGQSGESEEGERLLIMANTILAEPAGHQLGRRDLPLYTARIRAAQGRRAEAAKVFQEAVDHGWLPPAPLFKPDVHADAPLALLKGIPEFESARSRILIHAERERRRLERFRLSNRARQSSLSDVGQPQIAEIRGVSAFDPLRTSTR